jgi:hypothetical protein
VTTLPSSVVVCYVVCIHVAPNYILVLLFLENKTVRMQRVSTHAFGFGAPNMSSAVVSWGRMAN